MRDERLNRLARVIVAYSTRVKPGDLVRITGDPVALPLIEAIHEEVLRAGGHPFVKCSPQTLEETLLREGNDAQLEFVSPLTLHEVRQIDVSIGIWAETNTKAMSRADPARQSLHSAARQPIFKVFMDRAARGELRWCGTLYPTASSAQDAEMSQHDYENFVFDAGLLDQPDPVAAWRTIEARQQRVVDYLQGKKQLHFSAGNGTDLHVNVTDMTWVNCCGRENFPDGEVFTGPNLNVDDGGVNGYVKYTFPAVHHGREVHDIELWFEKGKVVKAQASKNEGFLMKMLDQDEGARRLGEIAIGTNYQIQQFSRNTLFDEKIGGTFHAAIGAGYPETGNSNESGLHWDMVCDLREGGRITVDGEMILENGRFVFEDWPGPPN